jgi:hypothetical protein
MVSLVKTATFELMGVSYTRAPSILRASSSKATLQI